MMLAVARVIGETAPVLLVALLSEVSAVGIMPSNIKIHRVQAMLRQVGVALELPFEVPPDALLDIEGAPALVGANLSPTVHEAASKSVWPEHRSFCAAFFTIRRTTGISR